MFYLSQQCKQWLCRICVLPVCWQCLVFFSWGLTAPSSHPSSWLNQWRAGSPEAPPKSPSLILRWTSHSCPASSWNLSVWRCLLKKVHRLMRMRNKDDKRETHVHTSQCSWVCLHSHTWRVDFWLCLWPSCCPEPRNRPFPWYKNKHKEGRIIEERKRTGRWRDFTGYTVLAIPWTFYKIRHFKH